jgi:hypothetical protein
MAFEETEAHPARPASLVLGEILDVDEQGTLHARALDHALPHKNLRVQVAVYGLDGRMLHKSRTTRTFIQENRLLNDSPSDGLLLGNHGFAYSLPEALLDAHRGQQLRVELVTYSDGSGLDWAHTAEAYFDVPPPWRIVLPPRRPRLDSGPVAPVRPDGASGAMLRTPTHPARSPASMKGAR